MIGSLNGSTVRVSECITKPFGGFLKTTALLVALTISLVSSLLEILHPTIILENISRTTHKYI